MSADATNKPQIEAGWYPNPSRPGERYWDGTQWTDQIRTAAAVRGAGASLNLQSALGAWGVALAGALLLLAALPLLPWFSPEGGDGINIWELASWSDVVLVAVAAVTLALGIVLVTPAQATRVAGRSRVVAGAIIALGLLTLLIALVLQPKDAGAPELSDAWDIFGFAAYLAIACGIALVALGIDWLRKPS